MRVIKERLAHRDDERGAVAVIVTLCLVAIFAMVVLTVDVGGLLLERRSMVNASDAAALAAAQSCADEIDTSDPETTADTYAKQNVANLPADGIDNITEIVGCDSGAGHVSVAYSEQHELFFAGVLPSQQTEGTISTTATAAWGPLGGGFAIPIVLDSDYLQGTCKVPDGIEIGDTCAFWYNNGDETLGDANWGFMNLSQWNVSPDFNCSNPGSNDRRDWIQGGYPDIRVLNGNPPGTAPTYVCGDTGAGGDTTGNSAWGTLIDEVGEVKMFPVNDCDGQLDRSGVVSPCPSTPDKYDIIGFTSLLIQAVYDGNDPEATGTPGTNGTCSQNFAPFKANGDITTGEQFDLDAFGLFNQQCFATAPDDINAASVLIRASHNSIPDYVMCATGQTTGCHYTYDPTTHVVTWTATSTRAGGSQENRDDLRISFGWSNVGTAGACEPPERTPDPNAKCVVTEWRGFTTGPGPVGGGTPFGASGIKLCDLNYAVGCPDQS